MLNEPLFMKNPEWYYYDSEEGILKLTASASDEARESYKEFYAQFETDGDVGIDR